MPREGVYLIACIFLIGMCGHLEFDLKLHGEAGLLFAIMIGIGVATIVEQ